MEEEFRNQVDSEIKKDSIDDLESNTNDKWKDIPMSEDFGKSWGELTKDEKIKRVAIGFAKGIALLVLLYSFVCSLDLLSLGFRVVGGKTTGEIFRNSDFLKNPIVGVMVGVLTTVLVQSSSTSTSIVVSMVAAGFLEVETAIPVIMGANIGTSVTSTIVSLTQVGSRDQFRRAFSGATIHDMFNWLSVISLLIVEVTTGYLFRLSKLFVDNVAPEQGDGSEIEILSVITDPFVDLIIQIDSSVLKCWSKPNCTEHDDSSLIKHKCEVEVPELNDTSSTLAPKFEDCNFLFAGVTWSDEVIGAIVLLVSLFTLCTCLVLIVKILNSVLKGQISKIIKATLNAKIPYAPWLTGYLAILVGAVMTFMVQSSSVFTSALTPLVGLGVLELERTYPLTLGSNIGTTTTALLAALATEGDDFKVSLQIAMCHLIFNITGILIFYPLPFMRFPIPMAKKLGETTANYRWFAILYMIIMFIIVPGVFMALSFAGSVAVIVFSSILFILMLSILLLNILQSKKPEWLPSKFRTWDWLPLYLRSLQPYDKVFSKLIICKSAKAAIETSKRISIDKDDGEGSKNNLGYVSD